MNPVVYPSTVMLSLKATPLTRLAEPNNAKSLEGYEFKLNSYRGNFDVTKAFGILYLNNTIGLNKYSNIMLNISWVGPKLGHNGSVIINVNISTLGMSPCGTNNISNINAWSTCSEKENEKTCIQRCGLGTGNFLDSSANSPVGCVWRTPTDTDGKSNGNSLTRIGYYTCVTNPRTCPDNWCDPHEELNPRLCPQDCTESKFIFGILNPSNKERGIGWTVGLCTCDHTAKCTCSSLNTISTQKKSNTTLDASNQKKANGTRKKFNSTSTTTTTIMATSSPIYQVSDEHIFGGYHMCGTACLSAVMTISIILSAIITLIVCKFVGESARRKMKPTGTNSNIRSTDTLITLEPIASPVNESPVDTDSALLIDPEWEFPRERMKIDFCLGEGEFGKVLKAQATNIAGIPGVTTVAVKTLKDGAGEAELADLLSEYQMLKELSHPNVIKLLGASTAPGGPVYLIMEFANHGCLKSYLRRHRPVENTNNPGVAARAVNEHSVTPKDILSFAWQIAKGMAYLSDMKLVHRDLAARNVLVASGKVCKISDFGLTRDIYMDETYLKRSKGKVPVKWMALESLSDQIYTIKSDVWGFGILLWELVTMGSSPYPGIAVQNLFFLLKSGYRMEKPTKCSDKLYDIMTSCWFENPSQRPTFHQLEHSLETMLEDGIDYLELDTWFASNRLYFSDLLQKDTTLDSGNSSDTENANNAFEGVAEAMQQNKILNDKTSDNKGTDSANIEAHYANDNVTLNTYKNFPNNEMYAKMANGYVNCKPNEV
ncbi:proto-oncogene tyrosine-protein kinase receptor Ret [Nilaparvata lugens]|uniref:proto-oncogene tyrosine-protein kinase receptor Ret n=1 Tax=Nilaparvata lugens TaxID=108931 RepID=UPI00193E280F|nr:proto-oncogene tyrosine-protein kinase receptor Ret [Nilaparvata lugens]